MLCAAEPTVLHFLSRISSISHTHPSGLGVGRSLAIVPEDVAHPGLEVRHVSHNAREGLAPGFYAWDAAGSLKT